IGAPVAAIEIARVGSAHSIRSLGETPQLLPLARAFRQKLRAARIDSGDQPEHAFVARSRSPRRQVVKSFPVQSAAQPPVIPDVESETAPQRNPLSGFVDVVGPDLPSREFLIVRRARL